MIRPTRPDDSAAVLQIIRSSGQFDAEGLAFVEQTLHAHLRSPGPAIWLTADDGEPVGVAYAAPEPVGGGVWNLLMLWLRADRHGRGLGTELVAQVEAEVRRRRARLLIVETSGLPAFEAARAFYVRAGFTHEATIRHYFAPGDDKLIFTKPVALAEP